MVAVSDLVARLRAEQALQSRGWPDAVTLEGEAADEIERLRRTARRLIASVREKYPGEELYCPHLRALDDLVNEEDNG